MIRTVHLHHVDLVGNNFSISIDFVTRFSSFISGAGPSRPLRELVRDTKACWRVSGVRTAQ